MRTLGGARRHNAFQRVYLVAPPQLLRKMVAGELNKDLTKVPMRDLPQHLDNLLPV